MNLKWKTFRLLDINRASSSGKLNKTSFLLSFSFDNSLFFELKVCFLLLFLAGLKFSVFHTIFLHVKMKLKAGKVYFVIKSKTKLKIPSTFFYDILAMNRTRNFFLISSSSASSNKPFHSPHSQALRENLIKTLKHFSLRVFNSRCLWDDVSGLNSLKSS